MKIDIPPYNEITNQWFEADGNRWVITRLFELAKDLPVQEMPITALNLHNLHPKFDTMRDFVGHIKSVQNADLNFPIILDEDGYVMDGRHKIAKALLEGCETIKFVRFESTPRADYTVGDDQ